MRGNEEQCSDVRQPVGTSDGRVTKRIRLVSSSKDNNTRVFGDGGAGTVGAGERQSSGRVVDSGEDLVVPPAGEESELEELLVEKEEEVVKLSVG